jgi:hypothetical protein
MAITRGGGWDERKESMLRSGAIYGTGTTGRYANVGFRIVLSPNPSLTTPSPETPFDFSGSWTTRGSRHVIAAIELRQTGNAIEGLFYHALLENDGKLLERSPKTGSTVTGQVAGDKATFDEYTTRGNPFRQGQLSTKRDGMLVLRLQDSMLPELFLYRTTHFDDPLKDVPN